MTPAPTPDLWGLLLIIGAVSMLPFVAVLATSYTKLVIVFSLLRQALGLQQTPPNLVLNGLAIMLTVYIMTPVLSQTRDLVEQKFSAKPNWNYQQVMEVFKTSATPLKSFMSSQVKERDKAFFMKAATQLWPKEQAEQLKPDDLNVLVPAFTVSELTEAFTIGFVLYLVFVVIDLVVGNILLALGMSMISPTIVSVPFKLLLFLMLEGWFRLIQNLVLSYKI